MGHAPPTPGRPRKTPTALSRWIDAQGLSRDAVAKRLGIRRESLDRLCRGDRRPSLPLALKIESLTKGAVPAGSWMKIPPHSGD